MWPGVGCGEDAGGLVDWPGRQEETSQGPDSVTKTELGAPLISRSLDTKTSSLYRAEAAHTEPRSQQEQKYSSKA